MFDFLYFLVLQKFLQPVLGAVLSNPVLFTQIIIYKLFGLSFKIQPWFFWSILFILSYAFGKKKNDLKSLKIILYSLTIILVKVASFVGMTINSDISAFSLGMMQITLVALSLQCTFSENSLFDLASLPLFLLDINVFRFIFQFPSQFLLYPIVLILVFQARKFMLISLLIFDVLAQTLINVACEKELESQNLEILSSTWKDGYFVQIIQNKEHQIRMQRDYHSIIGAMYIDFRDSAFVEFHLPDALILTKKNLKDFENVQVLIIGLGIGVSAYSMKEYKADVLVVDINENVVNTAVKFFRFPTDIPVNIQDGYKYLEKYKGKFDFIIHDVFTNGIVPGKLYSVRMMQTISQKLNINGILVINYVGIVSDSSFPFLMFVKTIKNTFTHIKCYADIDSNESLQNCFCFASHQDFDFRQAEDDDSLGNEMRHKIFKELKQRYVSLPNLDRLIPIIDDANISLFENFMMLSLNEHWKAMHRMLPPVLWLLD
eukprot:NODE_104_length_19294_cov_0.449179.p4 type:complete len:488 gc:universal NODE_104_length_19294_cov_0.449179:2099-636(-)